MRKCYRIWFNDGTAILRDAEDEQDAIKQGTDYLKDFGRASDSVKRVDCLDT